jgi:cytochrome c oxidase subunit 2
MKVDFYEKLFLWLTAVTLVLFLGAIGTALFALRIDVPAPSGRVDPARLDQTPPFDSLGLKQEGNGHYKLVMVAQIWSFVPNEVHIPAGSTLEIDATSRDVIHGLHVLRTDINIMVIPGEVAHVVHTFREPGEYLMVCHEYCGIGHQGMYGKIIVDPAPAGTAGRSGGPVSG